MFYLCFIDFLRIHASIILGSVQFRVSEVRKLILILFNIVQSSEKVFTYRLVIALMTTRLTSNISRANAIFTLIGMAILVYFVSDTSEKYLNNSMSVFEKGLMYILGSILFLISPIILSRLENFNTSGFKILITFIGILIAVFISYYVLVEIVKDPIGSLAKIVQFLIVVILFLSPIGIMHRPDLPDNITNLVVVGGVGWAIFYILSILSTAVSLYFAYTYSLFILYKIQENDRILRHRN